MGVQAQHMPKPVQRCWSVGMTMALRVAVASLAFAHDAQDARRIRLQHLDNNHQDATAKHSQN